MEKKRLNYIDMVKGLCILMVVLFHLLAPCGFSKVIAQVTPYTIVAFFAVSGYFYRPGKRTPAESILNRAKSLMTPFFTHSLFFWAVGTVVLVATNAETILEAILCLRNFLGGCIWNRTIQNWFNWEYYSLGKRYLFLADFWFLLAMLFASILFFLVIDHVIGSKGKTLLTAAGLFAVTGLLRGFAVDLPYNLQLVPFWTAFMILGAFAGNYKLFDLPSLTGGKAWAAGLGCLAVGIAVAMITEPNSNLFRGSFAGNEVVSMLIMIPTALVLIWGLCMVCKCVEDTGIRVDELAWLGSHSLIFYLYHMFFAWAISMVTGFALKYPEDPEPSTVALSFVLAFAVLGLCTLRCVAADKAAEAIKAKQQKPAA